MDVDDAKPAPGRYAAMAHVGALCDLHGDRLGAPEGHMSLGGDLLLVQEGAVRAGGVVQERLPICAPVLQHGMQPGGRGVLQHKIRAGGAPEGEAVPAADTAGLHDLPVLHDFKGVVQPGWGAQSHEGQVSSLCALFSTSILLSKPWYHNPINQSSSLGGEA